jgi:hypothetical protein
MEIKMYRDEYDITALHQLADCLARNASKFFQWVASGNGAVPVTKWRKGVELNVFLDVERHGKAH